MTGMFPLFDRWLSSFSFKDVTLAEGFSFERCAYRDCEKYGLLGVEYWEDIARHNSLDAPLLLCHEHSQELGRIYSIYKALESECEVAFQSCSEPKLLNKLDPPFSWKRADFVRMRDDIELAVTLRQDFQKCLKTPGKAHQHAIGSLRRRMHQLTRFIDNGCQKWIVVSRRK